MKGSYIIKQRCNKTEIKSIVGKNGYIADNF